LKFVPVAAYAEFGVPHRFRLVDGANLMPRRKRCGYGSDGWRGFAVSAGFALKKKCMRTVSLTKDKEKEAATFSWRSDGVLMRTVF
jgi:hypothetical protein